MFALVISLYSINCSTSFLHFLFSSPFNNSDTSILSSFDNGRSKDISGVPLPVSHLEMAFSVTNNFSANSSWVIPNSFLFVLIS